MFVITCTDQILLKVRYMYLKWFIVCTQCKDIERAIELEEKISLIENQEDDSFNKGKTAISACNFYILWFLMVNYIYLVQPLKDEKGFL